MKIRRRCIQNYLSFIQNRISRDFPKKTAFLNQSRMELVNINKNRYKFAKTFNNFFNLQMTMEMSYLMRGPNNLFSFARNAIKFVRQEKVLSNTKESIRLKGRSNVIFVQKHSNSRGRLTGIHNFTRESVINVASCLKDLLASRHTFVLVVYIIVKTIFGFFFVY